MKKIIKLSLFVIVAVASVLTSNSFAQCPGCVVDLTCLPPGGGLCPDSVPAATVAVYYDEDVTFYMPPEVDTQLGLLPLLEMHIDAIGGLPFGINWTSNSANNTYYPNGNGGHGCVKLCGTPIGNPGVYNITVTVTATVDAGGLGNQQGQQNYYLQMVLLPGSSSNSGFTLSPPLGCEPVVVSFTNNNPSGGYVSPDPAHYGGFSYSWDFGNAIQSNNENPPSVLYSTAGIYPVTYTMTIDTFGFRLIAVNVTSANCTDCCNDHDLELHVFNSSNVEIYYYYYGTNIPAPVSVSGLTIPITPANWPLRIEIWDQDGGLAGPPDNCWFDNESGFPAGQCTLTLPPVNAYGQTTQLFNSGTGLTFNYVIEKVVYQVTVIDTVIINPVPPSTPLVTSTSPVCSGDSVLLTTIPGYAYEWFYNDTIVLSSTINTCWAYLAGNYKVRVIDLTGCSTMMPDTNISFFTAIPANFNVLLNSGASLLYTNITGTYSYQWQTWNGSAWVNISAPLGVQSTYSPPANGLYQLIAITANGCNDSDTYNLTNIGIEDQNYISQVFVYPNPATHSFTLDLKDIKGEEITVSIINMMGQTVFQRYYKVSGGNFLQNIDVSEFANGVYTIDIKVGNYNIRKKLIKD